MNFGFEHFLKKSLPRKLLKNTRGMSLFDMVVFLLIMLFFTLVMSKTISDLNQDQRPWLAIVSGTSILSLIVANVAWHYHKLLPLYLARKKDPDFDQKLSHFMNSAKSVVSDELSVDEWAEPKILVYFSFSWFRHYKISPKGSFVDFRRKSRPIQNINLHEVSAALNELSRRIFGSTNHWLVRYWFSLDGMQIKSGSMSMHQIMKLHAEKRELLDFSGFRDVDFESKDMI